MTNYALRHPQDTETQIVGDDLLQNYLDEGWTLVAQCGGDIPSHYEIVGDAIVPCMSEMRRILRDGVTRLRDLHQEGTCNVPGVGVIQCDEKSKLKINGLVTMATLSKAAGRPFNINFTKADNSRKPLDADGVIGLGVAVGEHVLLCHEKATALKEAIEAATTVEELDAIDIETGWPQ